MSNIERLDQLERRIEMLEALVLRMERGLAQLPSTSTQALASSAHPLDVPTPKSWPVSPAAPPDPTWIPILHRMERADPAFPRPCGKPALYLTEPPREKQNARLDVMRVRSPWSEEWKIPTPPTDEPRCAGCWAEIDPFSNADLDYLSHMLPAGSKRPRKRDRRKSEEDIVIPQGVSPGPVVESDPLLTFAGHTPEASFDVQRDIAALQRIARQQKDDVNRMFDDRRLR